MEVEASLVHCGSYGVDMATDGQGNYKVSHIFREGNKLADHLANYAIDVGEIKCYGFLQLDSQGRRIVNKDKLQFPYLRVKVARR